MNNIKEVLRQEFVYGYTTAERIYMAAMVLLQVIVFIIHPDSALNIIAGLTGVVATVLCAKGKMSFYFIGFIQTGTYLYLSYQNRFYGEVIENIFYLVTMVWGIFVWKKNMKTEEDGSTQVETLRFNAKQWIISTVLIIVSTYVFGRFLVSIGSQQAYTDSATNVLALFGQLLLVKRYREQWLYWILLDLLCIKLWFVAGNWSMVAMYVGWTINCVYGWYNWSKTSNTNVVFEEGVAQ